MTTDHPVLVTGATGHQGGAVARALLAVGASVRALVRDPQSDKARRLADLGATLARGDLDDLTSLRAAAAGTRAVFSMQTPDLHDLMGDAEVRHGRNLVKASRAEGVEQVVHSSVQGAGSVDLRGFDELRWGAWAGHYWRSKAAVEQLVQEAGFAHWTIVRPATFMENLIRPSHYFADLTTDRLLVAVDPDAAVSFVTVRDIGTVTVAAVADPARFDHLELELAGDVLSYRSVAEILSGALGTTIVPPGGPRQARAEGLMPEMASAQEFAQEHRLPASPEDARALGIRTTSFREWVDSAFPSAP